MIDSGIDLSHTAFQKNENHTEKVAIYRDYTQEGLLYTQAVSCYGGKVAVGGTVYHVGNIDNAAQQYRMTFLNLGELQPKLFPESIRQLAVLVDCHQAGV